MMEPQTAEDIPALPLRNVQTLLWDVLSSKINPVERDEVQSILGNLVEQNKDLFEEANTLGSILYDLEGEIQKHASRRKIFETPARALLEKDLKKMLSALNLANNSDHSPSNPVRKDLTGLKQKAVMDYLQGNNPSNQKGLILRSRPGSSCNSSRPSTATSADSNASLSIVDVYKLLSEVESKLNIFEIDSVVPILKDALSRENEMLLEDIEYLQECLQDKSAEKHHVLQPPPTLSELKDFGKDLEQAHHVEKLLDVNVNVNVNHPVPRQVGKHARKLRGLIHQNRMAS